jgi:hypothetical protein
MNIRVPARLPRWNGINYRAGLRGMGDDTSDWNTLSSEIGGDSTVSIMPVPDTPVVSAPVYTGTGIDTSLYNLTGGTSISTPSTAISGGSATGTNNTGLNSSVLNALVKGGLNIATIAQAQQTPAGTQLTYNSAGQLVSTSTEPAGVALGTTSTTATIGGLSVNMLMVLGIAAVALMAMQAKR